jgi:hypothetical protein
MDSFFIRGQKVNFQYCRHESLGPISRLIQPHHQVAQSAWLFITFRYQVVTCQQKSSLVHHTCIKFSGNSQKKAGFSHFWHELLPSRERCRHSNGHGVTVLKIWLFRETSIPTVRHQYQHLFQILEHFNYLLSLDTNSMLISTWCVRVCLSNKKLKAYISLEKTL